MSKIYKNLMGNNSKIHPEVVAMADYVIEQGENYTKWASGKMECWGSASVASSTSVGGTAEDVKVYFGVTFESVESLTVSVNRPGGYNNISVQGKGVAADGTFFFVNVWRNGGGLPDFNTINYNAIGRWK